MKSDPLFEEIMPTLKKVCYCDGIVEFNVPAAWNEKYVSSGGATFCGDAPGSGMLCQDVIKFHSNGRETAALMIAGIISKCDYQPLHRDLAFKNHVIERTEDGQDYHIHCWEVGVPVSPCSIRVAVFSFAILASQARNRATINTIKLLTRSIRTANYSRQRRISGDY